VKIASRKGRKGAKEDGFLGGFIDAVLPELAWPVVMVSAGILPAVFGNLPNTHGTASDSA